MPLMGGSLMDMFLNVYDSVNGFSDKELAIVAHRMLTALCYLHDKLGVVHRDIKCALQ